MGLLAIILMATKSTSVDIEKKAQKEAVAHGGVNEIAHLNDLPKLVLNYLMANSDRALRV
jgi:hypothetical protein